MKGVPDEQISPQYLLHARGLISGVGGLPDFGFLAFFGSKKPLFPYFFWWYHGKVVPSDGDIMERWYHRMVVPFCF